MPCLPAVLSGEGCPRCRARWEGHSLGEEPGPETDVLPGHWHGLVPQATRGSERVSADFPEVVRLPSGPERLSPPSQGRRPCSQ